MDPLLHHLGTAAWLWLPVIALLGMLHAARAWRSGSGSRWAALAVAATCAWMGLLLASAWLGAALGGRPGLVLALLATMLLPFATLAHPRVRDLVERSRALHEPPHRSPPPDPAPESSRPWASMAGSNRRL